MGPHSLMSAAHSYGIPSSCTYGVRSDSWRAHPNCTPAAIEATTAIFFTGLGADCCDDGNEATTVSISASNQNSKPF
ncbi:hypothetical protein LINPERPRIM_LOCUS36379 [Linum perenne]